MGMPKITIEGLVRLAKSWPRSDQEDLLAYAHGIEARCDDIYHLTKSERLAVAQGLAEADQGKFVANTELRVSHLTQS